MLRVYWNRLLNIPRESAGVFSKDPERFEWWAERRFTPNNVKSNLYLQCSKGKAKAIPKHQVYSYTTTAPSANNDRAGRRKLQLLLVHTVYT